MRFTRSTLHAKPCPECLLPGPSSREASRARQLDRRARTASSLGHLRRRTHVACANADAKEAEKLPIFPLGMVALPSADIPLQIFEARYRVLFSTLLAGEQGIEPELVQEDSPFHGTKRFGMCYVSQQGLSAYGTVLEIVKHDVLKDGRLLVLTKGRKRFAIQNVVQERPVLLCNVSYLDDEENEEALEELADTARALFRQVLKLHAKSKKMRVADDLLDPLELRELPPSQLSFWMVSMFVQAVDAQQTVLQMNSARERFEFIMDKLNDTLKQLAANVALESVFSAPAAAEEGEDGETDMDGGVGVKARKAEGKDAAEDKVGSEGLGDKAADADDLAKELREVQDKPGNEDQGDGRRSGSEGSK